MRDTKIVAAKAAIKAPKPVRFQGGAPETRVLAAKETR